MENRKQVNTMKSNMLVEKISNLSTDLLVDEDWAELTKSLAFAQSTATSFDLSAFSGSPLDGLKLIQNAAAVSSGILQPQLAPTALSPKTHSSGANQISVNSFGGTTPAVIINVNATLDNNVNALLTGTKWASTDVTFSFTDSATFRNLFGNFDFTDYEGDYLTSNPERNIADFSTSFRALNATQKAVTREWLQKQYFNVSFINPIELTGANDRDATIRIATTAFATPGSGTATGMFPDSIVEAGDVWISNNSGAYDVPVIGNFAYATFGHEYGHALGLKHGHQSIAEKLIPNYGTQYNNPAVLSADRDSSEFSIMTYHIYIGHTGLHNTEEFGNPQTLMMYDIRAIQHLYGAYFEHEPGNTSYTFSTTTGEMFINGVSQGKPGANRIFRTVWDGNGIDTYNFSNYSTNLAVDLTPGSWSNLDRNGVFQKANLDRSSTLHYARGHVFNALQYNGDARSLIENSIGGTGNDSIKGNTANNKLEGGAGNDSLDGGFGNDTLLGQAGNDLVDGGLGADVMDGGIGIDTLNLTTFVGNYALNLTTGATNVAGETAVGFENVNTGNGNDDITGSVANNIINTGAGVDTVSAGAGNDSLNGGAGNDLLEGNAGADRIDGGAGIDYVSYYHTSTTFVVNLLNPLLNTGDALGDTFIGIENLEGSLTTSGSLTGNASDNAIYSYAGNDTLNGGGGNDALVAGAGNDSLNGGIGNDYLAGELGNDTYVVEGSNDVVFEALNQGIDVVQSSASYVLGVNIENLTLLGIAANGTGNALNNNITGNASANILTGGTGNDTLSGNDGNDNLYAGTGNDSLNGGNGNDILRGGAGADRLDGGTGNDYASYYDSLNPTLTVNLLNSLLNTGDALGDTFMNIEWLQGSLIANNNLTGNAGSNNLYSYNGSDTLNGGSGNDLLSAGTGNDSLQGGAGNDTLYGGAGNDRFQFSSGLIATTVTALLGIDMIGDFSINTVNNVDKIVLSKATFSAISSAAGALIGTNFGVVLNDAAVGAAGRSIVYSQTTGHLFYNPNLTAVGFGATGGQFANLTANLALTANDFVIIA
jgi:serralysin